MDAYNCDACQCHKLDGRSAGHLAPHTICAVPWEQVDIDLIIPWTVQVKTGSLYEFMALTCIDRITGLAELICIDNKTMIHIAAKFDEYWLLRYPRHITCCHNNGGEFMGWVFQQLLEDYGIKDVPMTGAIPRQMGCASACVRQ